MRFIVTADLNSQVPAIPSNSQIKAALRSIGFEHVSVVWVNSEALELKDQH